MFISACSTRKKINKNLKYVMLTLKTALFVYAFHTQTHTFTKLNTPLCVCTVFVCIMYVYVVCGAERWSDSERVGD